MLPCRAIVARLIFALALTSAALVGPPSRAADAPRVVNVTTDSERGWTPSVEQERLAEQAAKAFLGALDEGRAGDAYAMLGEASRREQSRADFAAQLAKFNALAGPVKERRVLKITWTKDSPRAPFPGVFVAIDLLSRFDGVDRHCGYIVLHQASPEAAFSVTRREDAYIDNATARGIAESGAQPGVDALSANI